MWTANLTAIKDCSSAGMEKIGNFDYAAAWSFNLDAFKL